MTPNLEAKCLEVLADAVSRTVGTGFVHAAVIKAAESLDEADHDKASKAFQLLSPRETQQVRSQAIGDAEFLRDQGEIPDPLLEDIGNPAYAHVRHTSQNSGGA